MVHKSIFAVFGIVAFCMVGVISTGSDAASSAPLRLLVFGDSLVAGYGLPQGAAFPDQLGRSLDADGYDISIINGGVSGDTTAGGASRIDWSLADKSDGVIIILGGNDALRGLAPDDMERNLDLIIKAIQSRNIPMILAGMRAPANMGAHYGKNFDQAFLNVAKKGQQNPSPLIFYPFFLDGVALEQHLNQNDGIHPNSDGVAVIVERIRPAVDALLVEMALKE